MSTLRALARAFARMLPRGVPEFIYERVLRGPLRTLFNWAILRIIPEQVRIPEGWIVLNRADPVVSGLLTFGMYEPHESALFRQAISPTDIVVDIGANVGYFALIAARRAARVIAFEPEPENRACLKVTVAANALANVDIVGMAVAKERGNMTLHLYDANKGKHSLVKDSRDAKGFNRSIEVPVVDLDSFCAEHHIVPTVIKMDIEGAEGFALQGMQHTLTQCRALFFELTPNAICKSGYDPVDILRNLRDIGFVVYEIDEHEKRIMRMRDPVTLVARIAPAHAANLYCVRENTTNL